MSSRQMAAIAGLLAFVTGAAAFALYGRIYLFGESADAEVVDVRFDERSGSAATCFPVFRYLVDGAEREERGAIGTAPCAYEVGEETRVYYATSSPDSVYPLELSSFWPLVIPIGLLFIAARLAWPRSDGR